MAACDPVFGVGLTTAAPAPRCPAPAAPSPIVHVSAPSLAGMGSCSAQAHQRGVGAPKLGDCADLQAVRCRQAREDDVGEGGARCGAQQRRASSDDTRTRSRRFARRGRAHGQPRSERRERESEPRDRAADETNSIRKTCPPARQRESRGRVCKCIVEASRARPQRGKTSSAADRHSRARKLTPHAAVAMAVWRGSLAPGDHLKGVSAAITSGLPPLLSASRTGANQPGPGESDAPSGTLTFDQ